MPRCIPSWTPFFNRFLADFYFQLRPPESKKSSPRCSESTIFQKIALRNWHRFLIDFGANLAPFCLPKSSKILPKIDPKMHQIFDRFLVGFGSTWTHLISKNIIFLLEKQSFLKNRHSKFASIFDPIFVPTSLHFGTKNQQNSSINRPQEASKKRSIFASIFYRFLIDFGGQLGAMLATFSLKIERRCGRPPSFLLGLCSFSVFWAS